jgi:hypothetical protein
MILLQGFKKMILSHMKFCCSLFVVACGLLTFQVNAEADVIVASLRGAVRPAGTGIGTPSMSQNYTAGGTGNFKNFFSYDLGTISNQWAITGTQVQIEHSTNNNNTAGNFEIWQVNESVAAYSTALWNDIGANASYGSVAVANAGVGFADVDLNSVGLMSLNESLGDSTSFVVGGTTNTSMFNGSSSFITRIDIALTDNAAPTAVTGDYTNFINQGIKLDGSASSDIDIALYGDSLTYSWMVNGMAAGTTSSNMLTLSNADLAGLGAAVPGTYAVDLTVTDEWDQTTMASGTLTTSVPEPGSCAVLCFGLVGLVARRRR